MKKATVQALSFLSGLTLAAVVLGVTISKSPSLRGEIESQVNTVLKTTRTLVDAYKGLASTSKTAAKLIKNDSGEQSESQKRAVAAEAQNIQSQWDALEAE